MGDVAIAPAPPPPNEWLAVQVASPSVPRRNDLLGSVDLPPPPPVPLASLSIDDVVLRSTTAPSPPASPTPTPPASPTPTPPPLPAPPGLSHDLPASRVPASRVFSHRRPSADDADADVSLSTLDVGRGAQGMGVQLPSLSSSPLSSSQDGHGGQTPPGLIQHSLSDRSLLPLHPILEGYLTKKGKTRHSWRLRWFVLNKEALLYYTKNNCLTLKGVILLKDIIAVSKRDRNISYPHSFEIATTNRVFIIRAATEPEREEWVRHINLHASRFIRGQAVAEEIQLSPNEVSAAGDGDLSPPPPPSSSSSSSSSSSLTDSCDKHRTVNVYVDVVIVEGADICSTSDLNPAPGGWMSYFTAKKTSEPDPFVSLAVGVQEYVSSTIAKERNPIWNEDCTFTLPSGVSPLLNLLLYDRNDRYLGTNSVIGSAHLDLALLSWNTICDVWVEFNALSCDDDDTAPPATQPLAEANTPPVDSSSPKTPRLSQPSPPPPITPPPPPPPLTSEQGGDVVKKVGKLHLLLFKSHGVSAGFLAHWGKPMKSISLRVGPGDLIFVSSPAATTQAVKLATGSPWDHVAMVTCVPGNALRLRLFEATMEGVHEYGLDYALAVYHSNCKVAIRRLLVDPSKEQLERLWEFIEEVRGRPYKQDWWQILRATSGSNKEDDLSSIFCSQLIAAAYQRMGLLALDHHSNNFVPGDFFNCDGKTKSMSGMLGPPIVIERKESAELLRVKDKSDDPFGLARQTMSNQYYFSAVSVLSARNIVDDHGNRFTSYCIEIETTQGKTWSVWRRYNAFYELDRTLRKVYEGIRQLPAKTVVRNRFDPAVIKHRCAQLHSYLQPLIKGPTAADPALLHFLGCGEDTTELRSKSNIRESVISSAVIPVASCASNSKLDAQIRLVQLGKLGDGPNSPARLQAAAAAVAAATNISSERRRRRKKNPAAAAAAAEGDQPAASRKPRRSRREKGARRTATGGQSKSGRSSSSRKTRSGKSKSGKTASGVVAPETDAAPPTDSGAEAIDQLYEKYAPRQVIALSTSRWMSPAAQMASPVWRFNQESSDAIVVPKTGDGEEGEIAAELCSASLAAAEVIRLRDASSSSSSDDSEESSNDVDLSL